MPALRSSPSFARGGGVAANSDLPGAGRSREAGSRREPWSPSWASGGGAPATRPYLRTLIGVDPPSGDGTCGIVAGAPYQGPGPSPDRADAMVWALTELMLKRQARVGVRIV